MSKLKALTLRVKAAKEKREREGMEDIQQAEADSLVFNAALSTGENLESLIKQGAQKYGKNCMLDVLAGHETEHVESARRWIEEAEVIS